MKKVLLYIWQLPQHIVALLVLLCTGGFAVKAIPHKTAFVYKLRVSGGWGVSLGSYILLARGADDAQTRDHEYGHSLQSQMLGPLYLIIVGLPSVVMNLLSRAISSMAKTYYKRWPESWADKLGGVTRGRR